MSKEVVLISVSLCDLSVLCDSVVNVCHVGFTTEAQSPQRMHREVVQFYDTTQMET